MKNTLCTLLILMLSHNKPSCPSKNMVSDIYYSDPIIPTACFYSGTILATTQYMFKYFISMDINTLSDDIIVWLGSKAGQSVIYDIFDDWLFSVNYDGKIYVITQKSKYYEF